MKLLNKRWHFFTLLAIIFMLILMIAYNNVSFNSSIESTISNIGRNNIERVSEELKGYLNSGMNVVQTTVVSVEYMMNNNASSEEIEAFLKYESERYNKDIDKNFTGIYGLFDEKYIDGIGWIPEEDYNPRSRDWYITAVKAKGEPVIVSPYLDAQTNTIMISISQMLMDGDSVLS